MAHGGIQAWMAVRRGTYQQIALGSALATLAQAERLEQINERLRGIHQVLHSWALKAALDGGR